MKFPVFFLMLLAVFNVSATTLSLTPTSLLLSPEQNNAVLNFSNRGDNAVTLQIFVKSWTQDEEGKTQVAESRDLVVFPKLLTLKAGQERPIRIGYQGEWPEIEQSYRIFADEVSTPQVQPGAVGVVFPVRISVPVFVRQQRTAQEPQWQIESAAISEGILQTKIHNVGRQHLTLTRIEVDLFSAQGKRLEPLQSAGGRVLAQGRVNFSLPLQEQDAKQIAEVEVRTYAQHQEAPQTRRFALFQSAKP